MFMLRQTSLEVARWFVRPGVSSNLTHLSLASSGAPRRITSAPTKGEPPEKKTYFQNKLFVTTFVMCGLSVSVAFYAYSYFSRSVEKMQNIKDNLDRLSATSLGGHIVRHRHEARPDYDQKLRGAGFHFANNDGIHWLRDDHCRAATDRYWTETASYSILSDAARELASATYELHSKCLAAVDKAVQDDVLLDQMQIPDCMRPIIKHSWASRDQDLIGRFDLAFDGTGPPKLLEYNADCPTVLVESMTAQSQWPDEVHTSRGPWTPSGMTSNVCESNLRQKLVAACPTLLRKAQACSATTNVRDASQTERHHSAHVVFTRQSQFIEESDTVQALASTLVETSKNSSTFDAEYSIVGMDYMLDTKLRSPLKFVDGHFDRTSADEVELLKGTRSTSVWKLYPYEWLSCETSMQTLQETYADSSVQWLEPPWKLILSNKGLLPLLWTMYPEHDNLLPAFWDEQGVRGYKPATKDVSWVAKPIYGREGCGIRHSRLHPSAYMEADQALRGNDERYMQTYHPSGVVRNRDKDWVPSSDGTGLDTFFEQIREDERHRGFGVDARLDPWEMHSFNRKNERTIQFDPVLSVGGGTVFQQHVTMPELIGRSYVVGSWVVAGQPAGICFREDVNTVINDDSCFVPHWVSDASTNPEPTKRPNAAQARLRSELYQEVHAGRGGGWTHGATPQGGATPYSGSTRPPPPAAPPKSYHKSLSGVRLKSGGVGWKFGSSSSS